MKEVFGFHVGLEKAVVFKVRSKEKVIMFLLQLYGREF